MLPRYTKLSACSTVLPSTVMLGGCGPEPMFWILVFAQETRRPSVDDEQLKLDKQLTSIPHSQNKPQLYYRMKAASSVHLFAQCRVHLTAKPSVQ